MSDRRPPPRLVADQQTPAPGSGEFRRGEARGAGPRVRVRVGDSPTRPDLPRYNPASSAFTKAAPAAGPRRFPTVEMAPVKARAFANNEEPPPSGRMLDDHLQFDLDLDADGGLELDCLPSSHQPRVEQPRQSSKDGPPSASRPSTTMKGAASASSSDGSPASRPTARLPKVDLGLPLPPPPPRHTDNGPPSSSTRRNTPLDGVPPSRPGNRGNGPLSTPRGADATQPMAPVDKYAAILAFAGFGDVPSSILGTPAYALRAIRRKHTLKVELAHARGRHSQDVGLYEASLRAADDAAVRSGFIVAGMALVLATLLAATVFQVCGGTLPFIR